MYAIENKTLQGMLGKTLLGTASTIGGMLNPAIRKAGEWLAFSGLPVNLPTLDEMLLMYQRGWLSESSLELFFSYYGITKQWLNGYEAISQQYLSPMEYSLLEQRGQISSEYLNTMLKHTRGDQAKTDFKKMLEYFPSVPDLIRFAVREAYTPTTITKFGLHDELPQLFLEEAKKAGLPVDKAKNYWAAHWELPSMQMGFEMLHRTTDQKLDEDCDTITCPSGKTIHNVIGTKTMDLLVKSLDITPFWRNKLKAISYNPLTRVDVRRMYAMGVIDEDKVFTSYLDEGYNEENALLLTNFVVKEYGDEMNGITRAVLEKAYKSDLITTEEFKENLIKLKYSEDTADFFVSLAEYDKHMTEIKSLIDSLTVQYSEGILTLDEIRAKITLENVPTSFVESAVAKITKAKIASRKLPSLADCQRWYKHDLIDKQDFITRLRVIGYSEKDTTLYEMEISGKLTQE